MEHKGILTRVGISVKTLTGTALTDDLVFQPLSKIHLASVCLLEDRLTKTMDTQLTRHALQFAVLFG